MLMYLLLNTTMYISLRVSLLFTLNVISNSTALPNRLRPQKARSIFSHSRVFIFTEPTSFRGVDTASRAHALLGVRVYG